MLYVSCVLGQPARIDSSPGLVAKFDNGNARPKTLIVQFATAYLGTTCMRIPFSGDQGDLAPALSGL